MANGANLAANQQFFLDWSSDVSGPEVSVNWQGNLFPVIVNGDTITVLDGKNWNWASMKATVGTVAGGFGGNSIFSWGNGGSSSLSFTAASTFDTLPGQRFRLGTLTFNNAVTYGGEADAANLDISLNFTNVPEKRPLLSVAFAIDNTLNTADPIASADRVTFDGFGTGFNVLEGKSASVDLYGVISSTLGVSPTARIAAANVFDGSPSYRLSFAGFGMPTDGGFLSAVPEPSTWMTMMVGMLLTGLMLRRRKWHSSETLSPR